MLTRVRILCIGSGGLPNNVEATEHPSWLVAIGVFSKETLPAIGDIRLYFHPRNFNFYEQNSTKKSIDGVNLPKAVHQKSNTLVCQRRMSLFLGSTLSAPTNRSALSPNSCVERGAANGEYRFASAPVSRRLLGNVACNPYQDSLL